MNLSPEQIARQKIDATLEASGWIIQDMKDFNRNAALGVAVREFQLPAGPCDYLLFIDGKAAGVIEAKKQGVTLSAVAEQSARALPLLLCKKFFDPKGTDVAKRAFDAMMQMTKIDIAAIETACRG